MPLKRTVPPTARHLLALLLLSLCTALTAQSLGSAFTYQGQLKELGQPAIGLYDIQTCLFDTPSNPIPLACAPDFDDVPVEGGLFAITLDFGSAPFIGQQRFLELRVRPGTSGSEYTILAPRQLIRPAPEALRSNVAAAAPWSGLTGVPGGFADGIDNDSGGTVTSIATGVGLTGGPITNTGSIAVAAGGIGATQINPAQVQARVSGNCAESSFVRAVNQDGTVVCDSAGMSNITGVTAGAGLTGGGTAGVVTVGIAPGGVGAEQINAAQVQARVTGSCASGQYVRIVNQDGTVECETDANSGGSVTSIETGAGLIGGPIMESGTVAVAPGGIGATQIDPSQVQMRVTGICPLGEYMRGVNADGSVICQSNPSIQPKLNDTGIDWCANAIANNLSCPLTGFPRQDGEYGRDARMRVGLLSKIGAGEAGFDYTKISNSGDALPASAELGAGTNDWGCTRDNVSGLIWEVKLNSAASLRHMGHTYTWYDTDAAINGGNVGAVGSPELCSFTLDRCDTSAYVSAVNSQGLCGASNWRMPTPEELQGIVHYGHSVPSIDVGYFPNTSISGMTEVAWTGRSFAANAPAAWVVNFRWGTIYSAGKVGVSSIRVVRSGQ